MCLYVLCTACGTRRALVFCIQLRVLHLSAFRKWQRLRKEVHMTNETQNCGTCLLWPALHHMLSILDGEELLLPE